MINNLIDIIWIIGIRTILPFHFDLVRISTNAEHAADIQKWPNDERDKYFADGNNT